MITEPIVFILGAGASKPYNYPTGAELKDFITNKLFMKLHNYVSKRESSDNIRRAWDNQLSEFVESFRAATGSIDLFLSQRPKFLHVGKLAILYSMFFYEQRSEFGSRSNQDEGDWYSYLYEEMITPSKGPGQISLGSNKVSFVTFNYDRSLENFLYDTSINLFGQNYESEIREQLGKIPIFHVYGKIADLPWDSSFDVIKPYKSNPMAMDFLNFRIYGGEIVAELHKHWDEQIFIIDEERSNYQDHIDKMKDIIRKSKRIYFLGFGFADENMNLLGFPNVLRKEHRIYGTTIDKTPHEIRNIQAKYMSGREIDSSHFNFEDMNCLKLLRNHL